MVNFMLWPFYAAFSGVFFIVGILFFIFWIWMIVDCAKRKFMNDVEKIVWIIVIVFGTWIGALIYFFAVKMSNPNGLAGHPSKSIKKR